MAEHLQPPRIADAFLPLDTNGSQQRCKQAMAFTFVAWQEEHHVSIEQSAIFRAQFWLNLLERFSTVMNRRRIPIAVDF